MKLKKGYYWIKIKNYKYITIGEYHCTDYKENQEYGKEIYDDGSGTAGDVSCWYIVGSDESLYSKEVEVIKKIRPPSKSYIVAHEL